MTTTLRAALARLDQATTATRPGPTPAAAPPAPAPGTPRPDPTQGARGALPADQAHRDALARGDIREAIRLQHDRHNWPQQRWPR